MIKQTAEIFEILSKGGFISSDSTNNQSELYDFFAAINFILESGNEYYYFSRRENKVDLERKLEIATRWIDVLDFIKTYDAAFSSGFRFQPADMVVKVGTDLELKEKLAGLKKLVGREKHEEMIDKIVNDLKRDGFIELENEITSTYKVVAAFGYLEELVACINISEEIQNEIPE